MELNEDHGKTDEYSMRLERSPPSTVSLGSTSSRPVYGLQEYPASSVHDVHRNKDSEENDYAETLANHIIKHSTAHLKVNTTSNYAECHILPIVPNPNDDDDECQECKIYKEKLGKPKARKKTSSYLLKHQSAVVYGRNLIEISQFN
ncbi:hypothetical protein RB195_008065 [Necator americanus]|uniref:Uncharacterized protein n=1 Tax=Necator americanus TaxID=51031 RepID=A0ABR1C089_NECAM